MDFDGFWDHTLKEINLFIEIKQEKEKNDLKTQCVQNYTLATLVGMAFGDPKSYPTIQKAFPGMFDDIQFEHTEPKNESWKILKDSLSVYNERLKDKLKKGEET